MQMNWFAFFPGLHKDENVGGDKIGFFVNPGREASSSPNLAARASRSSPIRRTSRRRCNTSSGSPQPEVQKKWWSLGGYSAAKSVRERPRLPQERALRCRLPDRMAIVKDFWAEPILRAAAARRAEAHPRLRRRRQGHRQGSARRADQGLDRRCSRTTARSEASGKSMTLWSDRLTWCRTAPSGPRSRIARCGACQILRTTLIAAKTIVVPTPPRRMLRRGRGRAPRQRLLGRRGARPLRPGDRLALHRADHPAAAGDQHLSADLDDPALLHQLPRQPAERAAQDVGLDNYPTS